MNQRIRGEPEQVSSKTFHYVYKIEDHATDLFYIGSRTSRVPPQDDLWVKYFTSSKRVKALIEEFGAESFSPSILSLHETGESAYWEEQAQIKESIGQVGCLNKHFVDPDSGSHAFNMAGVSRPLTPEQRKAVGDFHRGRKRGPQSEDHKRKISEAQKGIPRKPISEEHKEKIKAWNAKRWSDPDARKKQAEVMARVNKNRAKGTNENH